MTDLRRTLAGTARSHEPYPLSRMVELLVMIEEAIRHAEAGKPVVLFDWITLLAKHRDYCHAMVRILFLIITIKGVSADDVAELRTQLKATTEQRRRPMKLPRRPGDRLSPKLF